MRKFIVHAGFHKTATTTVQRTLEQHAQILSPHVEYLDRVVLKPVRKAAQVYSGTLDPVDLSIFQMRLCELLLTLDKADQRPVLMSSEDFSGYLIGRHGVSTYTAAVPLLDTLKTTLALVCESEPNLHVYFSTRRDGWLKSCHGQLSRNGATKLSEREFSETYASAADFDAIIAQVRSKLAPSEVSYAPIEALTGPLGPLQPLLDLSDVPTDMQKEIRLLPPQNVSPD